MLHLLLNPTTIAIGVSAFVAGRRTVTQPSRPAAGTPAPARPRTLAALLAEHHPRLEYAVRAELIGDTTIGPYTQQEIQERAARALLNRLEFTTLREHSKEGDVVVYRFGPLGARSALDAIRDAEAKGARTFLTLAAAFELIGRVPTTRAALIAFSASDTPSVSRLQQFARLTLPAVQSPIAAPPPAPPVAPKAAPATNGTAPWPPAVPGTERAATPEA